MITLVYIRPAPQKFRVVTIDNGGGPIEFDTARGVALHLEENRIDPENIRFVLSAFESGLDYLARVAEIHREISTHCRGIG